MDTAEFRVKKLYNAAVDGDVPSLLCLLEEDPRILDRCKIENSTPFQQSPLHVAVNIGHLEFTRQIIGRKPELAEEVDQIRRWSALHIASGKGHLEIVKVLLSASLYTCLARDIDGLNPVHVAAVKGQVHVLVELLKAMPQAIRGRTNDRSTVLHLCAQYGQIDALEHLISAMDESDELLNLRDADENTVLHLAVANNQPEMVTLLLRNESMEKNAINQNGLTAMDIISRSTKSPKNMEIRLPLEKANALKAKVVLKSTKYQAWIEKQQGELMVVATLIAGMAFQVGINPPGGSWQDDNDHHFAGHSIMADKQEGLYNGLLILSSTGFFLSLTVIIALLRHRGNRLLVGGLMFAMWTSLLATVFTYFVSVIYLTGYTPTWQKIMLVIVIEFCNYISFPLMVAMVVYLVAKRWCLSIASRLGMSVGRSTRIPPRIRPS